MYCNDAKSSYSTGTFVLIGGAALLVGGVAVAIINPGATSTSRTAWVVSPTIAPGLAGLSFGGAY